MKELERKALLASLVRKLRRRGSWCGETHLQKAGFLLQEVAEVPTGFSFVLYKYGPFSFDLRDEVSDMKAERILALEAQPRPYGPKLKETELGDRLVGALESQLRDFAPQLDWVAEQVGEKGVGVLEALTTAALLRQREPEADETDIIGRLETVKPHLSGGAAQRAVEDAERLLTDAMSVRGR